MGEGVYRFANVSDVFSHVHATEGVVTFLIIELGGGFINDARGVGVSVTFSLQTQKVTQRFKLGSICELLRDTFISIEKIVTLRVNDHLNK